MKRIIKILIVSALLIVGASLIVSAADPETINLLNYASLPQTLPTGEIQWTYSNFPVPSVRNSFRATVNNPTSPAKLSSTGSYSYPTYSAYPFLWWNFYGSDYTRFNFYGIAEGSTVEITLLGNYTSMSGSTTSTNGSIRLFFANNNTPITAFQNTSAPSGVTVPPDFSSVTFTDQNTVYFAPATNGSFSASVSFVMNRELTDSGYLFPLVALSFPSYVSTLSLNSIQLHVVSTTGAETGNFIVLNDINNTLQKLGLDLQNPYQGSEFISDQILYDIANVPEYSGTQSALSNISGNLGHLGSLAQSLNQSISGGFGFWSTFFKQMIGSPLSILYVHSFSPFTIIIGFASCLTVFCFLLNVRWTSVIGTLHTRSGRHKKDGD